MSRVISVFCDTTLPLSAICPAIEATLPVKFCAREIDGVGAVCEGTFESTFITAFEDHGLENDGGVEFTNYSIEIDFKGGRSEADLLEIAMKLAKRLTEQLQCATIVVENLQGLKASYLVAN